MSVDSPEPDPVASPCVGICCIGAEGYCIGCYRTKDELRFWFEKTSDQKRAILAECARRQAAEAE